MKKSGDFMAEYQLLQWSLCKICELAQDCITSEANSFLFTKFWIRNIGIPII